VRILDDRVAVDTTDEGQRLRVTGSGAGTERDLPSTFWIIALEQDYDDVVLHAADGRAVRATGDQLASRGLTIPPELDPDYEAHMDAELVELPLLPAADADDPALTAPLHDRYLGTITFDPVDGVAAYDVATPLGPVSVRFWGCGHERVTALLPLVHHILHHLPQVLGAAVELLWQWGANDADTPELHERFSASFGVRSVSVYHCGAFAVELSDDQAVFAESFLDGYWPAIHFLPNGQPVFVTIEC